MNVFKPLKDCAGCEERRKLIVDRMKILRKWMHNGLQGPDDPSQAVPVKNFPVTAVEKVDKPKT